MLDLFMSIILTTFFLTCLYCQNILNIISEVYVHDLLRKHYSQFYSFKEKLYLSFL
jgi:hypothetical protein